jgi:hypothetical protein
MDILESLHGFSFKRTKPDWADKIHTKKSAKIIQELNRLISEKQKIEDSITNEFKNLNEIEHFKRLLWDVEGGLENIVYDSLVLMGLSPSVPTKADDDGIFEHKGKEYMLEIKSGLERPATFTELSKLITRIENRKKIKSKDCNGIFIMNHYANHPLEDRDNPFPKNVRDTAKVNDVKLISTEQLFSIVKKLLDNDIDRKEAIKEFLSL